MLGQEKLCALRKQKTASCRIDRRLEDLKTSRLVGAVNRDTCCLSVRCARRVVREAEDEKAQPLRPLTERRGRKLGCKGRSKQDSRDAADMSCNL